MSYLDETHTKPILDDLNRVRQQTGYGWSRVFRDWIEIVFLSLQRDDDGHGELVADYEADFGENATKNAFEAYSESFGNLLVAMEATEADVIGSIHHRCGLSSDDSGQFFTPPNVARSMAAMMLPDVESVRDSTPTDPLRIGDPASGSGGLLVAAGHELEQVADSPYSALFVGQDIDPLCARMTAINLAVCGLPGYAIHGDSLKPKPMAGWKIVPSEGLMGAPIRECEPPAFGPTRGKETTARSTKPTAADGSRDGGDTQ